METTQAGSGVRAERPQCSAAFRLERRLEPPDAPCASAREAALELARRLTAAGHEALFAGGCVRDRLLGLEPKDHDIATSAVPTHVTGLFPGANEVGSHFGVVIAKHGGHRC